MADVARPCAFVFVRSSDCVLVSKMREPGREQFFPPPGAASSSARRPNRRPGASSRRSWASPFVFETWVESATLERLDGVRIVEPAAPDDIEIATAIRLSELRSGRLPVYPDGVLDLLTLDPR